MLRHNWGCRTTICDIKTKLNSLGSLIKEGDNPVHDIVYIPSSILSTAGSETPCRNLPAPSGKAKYSQETDSELVL